MIKEGAGPDSALMSSGPQWDLPGARPDHHRRDRGASAASHLSSCRLSAVSTANPSPVVNGKSVPLTGTDFAAQHLSSGTRTSFSQPAVRFACGSAGQCTMHVAAGASGPLWMIPQVDAETGIGCMQCNGAAAPSSPPPQALAAPRRRPRCLFQRPVQL